MLKFGESSNNSRDMDRNSKDPTGGDAVYIELGNVMPTGQWKAWPPEQMNLRRIRKKFGEVTIDLWNENEKTFNESDRLTSIEYPEGTKEAKNN